MQQTESPSNNPLPAVEHSGNVLAPTRTLLTVNQLAKVCPWTTPSGIRDLIHHSEPRYGAKGELLPANGLARALFRVGGRVLIDFDEFKKWLETFRGAPAKRRDIEAAHA
jgi:hypothetical protein